MRCQQPGRARTVVDRGFAFVPAYNEAYTAARLERRRLLFRCICQQHCVRIIVAALDGDLRTVERESEARDALCCKMRELPVRRAVEGLQPKIIDAFSLTV
jgi:hypothetical protein